MCQRAQEVRDRKNHLFWDFAGQITNGLVQNHFKHNSCWFAWGKSATPRQFFYVFIIYLISLSAHSNMQQNHRFSACGFIIYGFGTCDLMENNRLHWSVICIVCLNVMEHMIMWLRTNERTKKKYIRLLTIFRAFNGRLFSFVFKPTVAIISCVTFFPCVFDK